MWKVPSILQTWASIMRFIGLFLMTYNHQNAQFKGTEENMGIILKYLVQMTLKKVSKIL